MPYQSNPKKPIFTSLTYCTRCGMPSTEAESDYDELNICRTCRSNEQKMQIDWSQREKDLSKLLDSYKGKGDYDCIVPISGGKDSAYQLYLVKKVYGLEPLAVTFNQNWRSEVGRKNLEWCLETFDVDHIQFTPKRSLVNRCARRSLETIGDACWHCHAGIGAFPWQVAVRWNIPLIIFGESAAENGSGDAEYEDLKNLKTDKDYFFKISAKFTADEFACGYLSPRDLSPFYLPSDEDIESKGVIGIHLGNYLFWDAERYTEFIRDRYGWEEDIVEGSYKRYKSVECNMPGVHDFTCFLKRGFGKGTFFAAQDLRTGLMSPREANEIIREYDPAPPEILDYYLEISGYTEEEFYKIMDGHREKVGKLTREEIEAALEDYKRRFGNTTPKSRMT